MIGLGKHVWGVLAIVAGLILTGAVVWYCLFGFQTRDYEKEGTLVQVEAPEQWSQVCPAFVTEPASVVVDEAL